MEGVTNASALCGFVGSLRSVDTSEQGQKLARLCAATPPASPSSSVKVRTSSKVSEVSCSEEDAELIRETFRRRLLHRFHSMIGAWKQIDPQSHGRLSFFDFCRACRHMGCDGEARLLWEILDANSDGFITLEEVDPNLAILLEQFSSQLVLRCGTADAAKVKTTVLLARICHTLGAITLCKRYQ